MRLYTTLGLIFIVVIISLISIHEFIPSIYKDVKITDWVSSLSGILTFFVTVAAVYYAKNYLGQERHKNASNVAIDILHKDMVLLSTLKKQQDMLSAIESRTLFFIYSTSDRDDDFCIKHFASIYLNVEGVLESMNSAIEVVSNDIFKAKILGCTFKNIDNSISRSVKKYTILKDNVSRLTALICSQILPYYRGDSKYIDPEAEINIHFPDDRGTEREEMFGEILELTKSCKGLVLEIKSEFASLREGINDLQEVFNFE